MSQNMQTGQSAPSFQRTPNGPDNPPAQAEQASRHGCYGTASAQTGGGATLRPPARSPERKQSSPWCRRWIFMKTKPA